MHTSARVALASALFFISGCAALIYQTIWQRILGIFSGMHIYSITLIVTAFMAGLGFGSFLGGRISDRLGRRQALLAFGACELLIGLFALISPWLYYDVAYIRLGFLVEYPLALPAVHLLLLLFPTFLMGASLPLLARGLVDEKADAASTIGVLYGVNTLGASLGAFVSIWYLVGAYGFVGTVRLAAVLNFLAAVGALAVWRAMPVGSTASAQSTSTAATPVPPPAVAVDPEIRPFGLGTWAAIYALSGFIALSLELLWFRILDVTIKSSPYTFGHLLGLFLLFLGIGSLVGSRQVRRAKRPDLVFLWGQWAISLSAAFGVLLLSYLPTSSGPLADLYAFWLQYEGIEVDHLIEAWREMSGWPLPPLVAMAAQIYLLLPIALLAVPTFLMGWTYAFIQGTVQTDLQHVGWRVGAIQSANITGSILGSLLTGALFLDVFGTPGTLSLLLPLGAVFGCLALMRSRTDRRPALIAAVVLITLVAALAIPSRDRFWSRLHGSSVLAAVVAEDASSVVAITSRPRSPAILQVNGGGHSGLPYGGTHTFLGSVPALIHPNPKSALVIGLGSGDTAWALGLAASLEQIDVYEIARPELEVLQRFPVEQRLMPAVERLLADPRLRLTFGDGRLALRNEGRKYDLIEADALEPFMAYSGNLYSREFYELARDALNPGGLLCAYVPTERARRTVLSVMPYAVEFLAPDQGPFVIASNEPIEFDMDEVLARLRSKPVKAYLSSSPGVSARLERDLRRVKIVEMTEANWAHYAEGDINTDLFPRDEFDKHPVWEGVPASK